jgi:XTP/dITP diphosphohydrolase
MSIGRKFEGDTLVIATHNPGKAHEFHALLKSYVAFCPTSWSLGLPEPEETEKTFLGNAILKAKMAAGGSGKVALADDSGLAVTALGGAPGIYSARWALKENGRDKDFLMAMNRVESELGENPDRSAAFICALAIAWPDGHVETVEGRVDGTIAKTPRGANGFGYDPIFVPNGQLKTFAEMDEAMKHLLSHRADAFHKLIAKCFT